MEITIKKFKMQRIASQICELCDEYSIWHNKSCGVDSGAFLRLPHCLEHVYISWEILTMFIQNYSLSLSKF